MNKLKELGQVMTPKEIVEYMINLLNLSQTDIKEKTFIDNSCGDGEFIKGLIKIGVPINHIYACDIDPEISKDIVSLIPLENFYCGSIFDKQEWFGKFDYVIGNPPYVRIHNIDLNLRAFLKSNYSFCTGMFDLYYAFYEIGLKLLNSQGTLLYIAPNSFIKNASGIKMRKYIEENNLLWYFEDFEHEQKFANYSTYTAIVGLSKGNIYSKINIPWLNIREKKGLSFTSLQNGIATLLDKFFISDDFSFIEPDLVHPILKASTGEMRFVIVPPKTEDELKKLSKTYDYFKNNEDALKKRSLSGKTQWFEFGRTQGLVHMNEEKIAITTTVSFNGIKTYLLDKETYVYSGLYATASDLNKLDQQLHSQDLLDYLIENGKPMSGDYVQIGSTLLKNY